MVSADLKSFRELITGVHAYYRRDVSDYLLTIYWEGLKQYPLEAVTHAFNLHAKDPDRANYMPMVGDVVRIIDGTTAERAALAWTKVRAANRQHGYYRSVVFDDPIIHIVIQEMGGWGYIGDMKSDDVPFREKDFALRYKIYAGRGGPTSWPAVLQGQDQIQPVVYIGNAEKAKALQVQALAITAPQQALA